MKRFLVALSAFALLSFALFSGVASAQATDDSLKAGANSDVTKPVKKHRQSATTGSGGYSTLPPKNDPGRYNSLPGKDGLNSKAFIQDH